jgi:hypothetical protein
MSERKSSSSSNVVDGDKDEVAISQDEINQDNMHPLVADLPSLASDNTLQVIDVADSVYNNYKGVARPHNDKVDAAFISRQEASDEEAVAAAPPLSRFLAEHRSVKIKARLR